MNAQWKADIVLGNANRDIESQCLGSWKNTWRLPRHRHLNRAAVSFECSDFRVGQGRVMLDLRNFRFFGKLVVEVPAPASRIFTRSQFARSCPIENLFNSAAQPTGGFWFLPPDRSSTRSTCPTSIALTGRALIVG
jgi:hypothetical protein